MAGDMPWPEVPIGNKNHANAAVVIIGAGISGTSTPILTSQSGISMC